MGGRSTTGEASRHWDKEQWKVNLSCKPVNCHHTIKLTIDIDNKNITIFNIQYFSKEHTIDYYYTSFHYTSLLINLLT